MVKKYIKFCVKPFIKCLMYVFRIFPIKRTKIVFSSFSARSYSDNPKYILEELLKQQKDYDCVFVLNHPDLEAVPNNVRTVKHNTIRYLYEMATAKIWIDNTRKQPHIIKRKNQIYIQTWHGALWIKKIEKDAEHTLELSYIKTAKIDSQKIDYLFTNSVWGEQKLKSCFWYDGIILKIGSPRVDLLINSTDSQKSNLKSKIGLNASKKYALYAPTFRKDGNISAYNIDYTRLISNLVMKFGGEWCILIKLHPNIRETQLSPHCSDDTINMSMYPDINELYLISDLLITDYSSAIFDFSCSLKPAFLYTSDLDTYQKDRDVLFDLYNLPFPLAENNDELEHNILGFNNDLYIQNLLQFKSDLGVIEDGKACKRAVALIDWIINSSQNH